MFLREKTSMFKQTLKFLELVDRQFPADIHSSSFVTTKQTENYT